VRPGRAVRAARRGRLFAPLPLLNVIAGVVYALAMPFVALTTTYVYFDSRASNELEPAEPATLPAELELAF
jgi:hypothetical protein